LSSTQIPKSAFRLSSARLVRSTQAHVEKAHN
jgi:hypothetical protein